jgi:hypothetical protein
MVLIDNQIQPTLIRLHHDGSRGIFAVETDNIRPRLGAGSRK